MSIERAIRESVERCLRTCRRADTVLQCPPEWASARTIRALTGLNRCHLNRLAAERKVCAKRAGGNVIYRYGDVLKAIEGLPDR